mgnify:CR=1 FL=1
MSFNSAISETEASRTTNLEFLKDSSSAEVTVTTASSTLATLLGSALPDAVLGVTLLPGDNTIRYSPSGEAGDTNAALPSIYTIFGHKTILDAVELYAASSLTCGVIVHVPNFTNDRPTPS